MRRTAFLLCCLLVLALLWAPSALAQTSGSPISILNTEPLKVSGEKGEDTVEAKFSVLNNGAPTPIKVKFQASSNERVAVGSWNPETLPSGATRLVVQLTGVEDLSEAATGQLVVEGGEATVAQSVEIDPSAPDTDWPAYIIGGSLALALLVSFFVLGSLGSDRDRLNNAAPNPKWEFSSWATTLTALGAAFGTVLGSATFPEFPVNVSSAELVNLNILFGVLVLIGPFLFETLRSADIRLDPAKVERTGTNLTMLIASSFTLWAVLGQMGAFGLLGWELLGGSGFAYVAAVATGVFILLACWYFFTTMREQVRRNWEEEEKAAKAAAAQGAGGAPKAAGSWSLL